MEDAPDLNARAKRIGMTQNQSQALGCQMLLPPSSPSTTATMPSEMLMKQILKCHGSQFKVIKQIISSDGFLENVW